MVKIPLIQSISERVDGKYNTKNDIVFLIYLPQNSAAR